MAASGAGRIARQSPLHRLKKMDALTAIEHLQRAAISDPHRQRTLSVRIFSPGAIGGTPCIDVLSIQAGIDWDKGKILLEPATALTALSAEDVLAIRESAKKAQSWHAYQAHKAFTARIRQQAEQVRALEAQIEQMRVCQQGEGG